MTQVIPLEVTGARPKHAFRHECVRVEIANILPLKVLRADVKASHKYQQILCSVREVGLVEPPAVNPVPNRRGHYYMVDGHLRIEALKDLGQTEVDCLVAISDDTYTYNKRIARLSAVQDHKMIVRAMENGVSAERLGASLGVSPLTIRHRFRMLNGICDEAISLLVDTPCPATTFEQLRQMKPVRQIEAAELMVNNKNFSVLFAKALLSATPSNQLTFEPKQPVEPLASAESITRMERELAALQMQIKVVEDEYGPDVLHLTIVKGYLAKLLNNGAVVRWLMKNQPEYLKEFQHIAEMAGLPQPTKDEDVIEA